MFEFLSIKISNEVEIWNEDTVAKYLYDNVKGFDTNEVDIIKKNKINGLTLLQLTKDEMKEIELPFGIIKKIIDELNKIKNNTNNNGISTNNTNNTNPNNTPLRIKQKIIYPSFKRLDEVLNKYRINTMEIKLLPTFDIEKR